MNQRITVYGAYGHTGRFVVAELRRRGWTPVLAGRDRNRLHGPEVRVASVDDPASLDAALAGSAAVINCAGPFLDTNVPLIESAIRARIPYVDIAAEQAAVVHAFDRYTGDARAADIVIMPAVAFYGGLADVLATAALDDWDRADEISIAVALDRWFPTRGTRITGERNPGKRWIFADGVLERSDPLPGRTWPFPEPFGTQSVESLALAEAIVIPRHLRTANVRAYLNSTSLADVRNPDTPPPRAADESGRSSQTFVMDVIVRRGREERRITARGRDIYAISAPIVVEAAERILRGEAKGTGVLSLGQAFDARDFLSALPGVST